MWAASVQNTVSNCRTFSIYFTAQIIQLLWHQWTCCFPSETFGSNVVTQIFRSLQNRQIRNRRLESKHLIVVHFVFNLNMVFYAIRSLFQPEILRMYFYLPMSFFCVYIFIIFTRTLLHKYYVLISLTEYFDDRTLSMPFGSKDRVAPQTRIPIISN